MKINISDIQNEEEQELVEALQELSTLASSDMAKVLKMTIQRMRLLRMPSTTLLDDYGKNVPKRVKELARKDRSLLTDDEVETLNRHFDSAMENFIYGKNRKYELQGNC